MAVIVAELHGGFEIAKMSRYGRSLRPQPGETRLCGKNGSQSGGEVMAGRSVEDRLREIEDRLEIINLIAGHPPGADSCSPEYAASFWAEDGTIDMGGGEKPYETMLDILRSPGFKTAQTQGICHFSGLPYVEIEGDTAVATSYLQILAADPKGEAFELSAHGTSKGFRVLRLSANRWELVRGKDGWRIKNRTWRGMDNAESRSLLAKATQKRMAKRA
jgi:hypothetical protein